MVGVRVRVDGLSRPALATTLWAGPLSEVIVLGLAAALDPQQLVWWTVIWGLQWGLNLIPWGLSRQAQLRAARTCYDHLAGGLGMHIADAFIARRWLSFDPLQDVMTLTDAGWERAAEWGWDLDPRRRMPVVRPCLDWSERRYHVAGQVGRAVATWLFDQSWIVRGSTDRVVLVTEAGQHAIAEHFGFGWPPPRSSAPRPVG